MCKGINEIWRVVGKDLDVLAAATGDKETSPQTDANDGDVIGLSVARNYDDVDLASILLTVEVNGAKPLYNVPLTQLLPDYNDGVWMLSEPIKAGLKWKCKLTIRNTNTAVANPVVLIMHHRKPGSPVADRPRC